MFIVDAKPKDIHFLVDISLTNMESMKIILDNMQFNYDGSQPEHLKAKKFLEEVLYPLVEDITKEYENATGPNTE